MAQRPTVLGLDQFHFFYHTTFIMLTGSINFLFFHTTFIMLTGSINFLFFSYNLYHVNWLNQSLLFIIQLLQLTQSILYLFITQALCYKFIALKLYYVQETFTTLRLNQ
jgi:hypothetical protein